MPTKTYEWLDGSKYGVPAEDVHAELERIRTKNGGRLTNELVISAAKNKRSLLHPLFCWDDTEAAHQWRLSQSAQMIRSLRVRYVQGPKVEPIVVRAMVGTTKKLDDAETTPSKAVSYVTHDEALGDAEILEGEIARIRSGIASYNKALSTLLKSMGSRRKRTKAVAEAQEQVAAAVELLAP